MERRKRIEYLITTMCVLVTGFIVYGLVGSMEPLIYNSKYLASGCFWVFLTGGV